jgi:hypothetical protein
MKLELQLRTEDVDFESYQAVYFSEEFNQVIISAAKLRQRVLQSHEVLPDGREARVVRMVPEIALPAPLLKVIGAREIAYREVTVFDPRTRCARLDVKSPAGKLLKVAGEVRFVEAHGGVTLHFDGEVHAHVLGFGRMIEKFLVAQVQERYTAVAVALQQYLSRA